MIKLRKILRIKKEIYEKIKAEVIGFKRWIIGLLPRQRKAREKPVECKTTAVTLNGDVHYRDYTPTRIGPTRDSRFWQWRRVEEWYNDMDDFMDNRQDRMIDLSSFIRKKMFLKSFRRGDRGLVHINPWTKL